MSVRQSLLAILDQGDCYGSQLRAEYTRRTGATVNVGQIYTTLERLARDGLVENLGADDEGRILWGLTAAGRVETRAWLAAPSPGEGRDDLAARVALAVTLPGADVSGILSAQRAAFRAELAAPALDDGATDAAARAVVRAARRERLEAGLRWLDEVERIVEGAVPFGLAADRPRRGRPVRSVV